jgi:glycosyltransferase involved in cell wall biosynthesis
VAWPIGAVVYCGATVNVLFLSLDFVFPADRGLRVRSLSQLRVLSSIDAVRKITVLALSETDVPKERLRGLEQAVPKVRAEPVVIQPTHMRRSPRHLPRLIRLRALGVPYLVAKSDASAMRAVLARHLAAGDTNLVYVGHLGMAAYLDDARRLAPKARVVLEEHNVEWEIFERLAKTFGFGLRQAAHLEARALRSYERRALRAVDSVVAISDADAQAFKKLAGTSATVVPTYIEPAAPRTDSTRAPALAYTGLLAWQPNALGLDWFCRDVWPLVRARVPEATLTIAGPGLERGADGALQVPSNWRRPGITTVGYVDDLENLYRDSAAVIAPIIGGSGVRMKLLESMRAGMPTVTTTDGAAGLEAKDGREMFITDESAQFADGVVSLLSDIELRARMRAAGYAYLEARHSLAIARTQLERALSVSPAA